jgi:hypothetical protein
MWDRAVPRWLRGRRDEVIARLEAHSGHVLEATDNGYDMTTDDLASLGRECHR